MSAPIANPSAYDAHLARNRTAMANGRPDQIPIRPFVAEFTAKVAGMTNQEVTQDDEKAFEAARICAKTFDWDAVVPNMVFVWCRLAWAARPARWNHGPQPYPRCPRSWATKHWCVPTWENFDTWAYAFLGHCVVSF